MSTNTSPDEVDNIIKTTISNLNNDDISIKIAAVIKIGDLARTGLKCFNNIDTRIR
jgi:hypothetical protein